MTISTDFSAPRFLERDKTVTVDMPLYEDGPVIVGVASGTYTVSDGAGATIFTDAVTVTAGVASVQITAADLPATLDLSDRWMEAWELTLTDGRVETVYRDVYLCLRTIYPPVNEIMLGRRIKDLNNLKSASASDNFQSYIDEAWSEVEARLIQAGKRPFLITNAWALKPLHLALTRAYIFEDASTYMGDSGRYETLATAAWEEAKKAWSGVTLEYDTTQTGTRGSADSVGGEPVIYLNSPPGYFPRSTPWNY